MRPVLFRWKRVTIWSYPALLYVGLVAGVLAGNLAAHVAGVNVWHTYVATIALIIAALVGARLLFVAANWASYRNQLRRIFDRREGGYVMYGGLIAAVLLSIPLLKWLRVGFGTFWDISVFTILAGMIFTRVGCFLHGCCAGCESKRWFSARLPNSRGVWSRRVPTQLLEALTGLVLLIAAERLWSRMPFAGALFLLVTLAYSSARFVMEFAREVPPEVGRLHLAHVISAMAWVFSASALAMAWPK
jgi:phosphatidylglycerol---prolipoprotein diacylglyceryl transferase